MLTTGVDVPTCKNVVIVRTINSMTEFKQIIGRGTRVRDDYGKLFFNILDYTGSATSSSSILPRKLRVSGTTRFPRRMDASSARKTIRLPKQISHPRGSRGWGGRTAPTPGPLSEQKSIRSPLIYFAAIRKL
jgi:hypothetical protein